MADILSASVSVNKKLFIMAKVHRRVIQTLLRRPDKFALLVTWIKTHHRYPSMPSRLEFQQKIEELLGEKL